ncbi:SLC13 family permease [Microbulbifer flavimaris]|uniref:SLC13 family permease n=1 Tax=Microbulbifer flavimaris TaxID=1781068 RepID=A0ABX4HY97_9GAMM|nr:MULTISPECIES: SLC13 family permease [Microbulbifer]KUJ82426.1 sodium:sulfate symporter [Microbulbifer sp. ZGT114]PCO04630.1 SLC13 family permease [Microbulbifer flavimaris]
MTITQIFVAGLFALVIAALIFSRVRPSLVFASAAGVCFLTGLVPAESALQKAVNPGLVTLVVLILVSVGLEKTRWLRSVSDGLINGSLKTSLLKLTTATAVSSAFLNNTAVVAALASSVRAQRRYPAAKLLMPLSYAAILGGTMTLIGTSTNLIVNSFVLDRDLPGLDFFAFFPIGAAAALVGLVVLFVSNRLLPEKAVSDEPLTEYLLEAEVVADSPLDGKTVEENQLRQLETLYLIEIVRRGQVISPVSPTEVLKSGDKLIFSGDVRDLGRLQDIEGLRLFALEDEALNMDLTEVVITPTSSLIGQSLKSAKFRTRFDAAVVAMRRGGDRLSGKLGEVELQAGDALLLAEGPDFKHHLNITKNFYVISGSEVQRQLPKRDNWLLGLGFAAAIAGAALGYFSLLKGLVILLGGMIAFGIVSTTELQRRFPFQIWIIIASALVLAEAFSGSGLADALAAGFRQTLDGAGPYVALVGIFFLTLALTELMTNNAAAALAFPLAWSLAESFGVSWMPFVMAVAYGASASFLTPFGYQTNLMVQNLGGYHLRDFVRAGLPLTIAYSITVLLLLPVVFPF